ncbi:hypothetical protein [Zhongshania sp. BJYM1]|uniref:hypothetical protein n=1 Tax=Zhongshania aquatica TaxID=2965069 RepID=UPI0022B4FC6D|nr:hypothetical protein [Marortus sp. BJYM1]
MFIPIDHTKTTMQLSRLLRKLDKSRTRSIFIHRDGSSGDNINRQLQRPYICSALSI